MAPLHRLLEHPFVVGRVAGRGDHPGRRGGQLGVDRSGVVRPVVVVAARSLAGSSRRRPGLPGSRAAARAAWRSGRARRRSVRRARRAPGRPDATDPLLEPGDRAARRRRASRRRPRRPIAMLCHTPYSRSSPNRSTSSMNSIASSAARRRPHSRRRRPGCSARASTSMPRRRWSVGLAARRSRHPEEAVAAGVDDHRIVGERQPRPRRRRAGASRCASTLTDRQRDRPQRRRVVVGVEREAALRQHELVTVGSPPTPVGSRAARSTSP